MKGTRKSGQLGRREFLQVSSKALLVTAAGALVNPGALLAAAESSFDPLLSIGYAPSAPIDGAVRLAPAAAILAPDPLFISRGARVSILGAQRAPGRRNAPGSLFLDVMFPSLSGTLSENRRFRFWSLTGGPGDDAISANLSFSIPVPATTGISFMARYRGPDAASQADSTSPPPIERDNAPFALSLGNVQGPNLRRGVYVVALREPNDQAVAVWSALQIANHGGDVVVPGAPFSYVILSIDYAAEPRTRAVR